MELSLIRIVKSIIREGFMYFKVRMACDMRRKGYSVSRIAHELGVAESTARSYLAKGGMLRGC